MILSDRSQEDQEMAELGNVQQLKGMLQRLGAGEDLASVREDFVKSFKDVPVKDIMAADGFSTVE